MPHTKTCAKEMILALDCCLSIVHPIVAPACRAFIEKGWDCHDILRTLIKQIGDSEEDVIDIVLCAIENAT